MKTDRIELITQQHILNYIASSGKMTDIQIRDILGDPVPQVDSKCTIQQAIQLMEKEVSFQYQSYNLQHTSCLLIKWNKKEKQKYTRTITEQKPQVVTQEEINQLLLGALKAVSIIE